MRSSNFAPFLGPDVADWPIATNPGAAMFWSLLPQQALGRFNGFLKSVILRLNEARDLGDINRYQFYEHTKVFTAAPPDVLLVDEKFSRAQHPKLRRCHSHHQLQN
jgi:hypothetical protein